VPVNLALEILIPVTLYDALVIMWLKKNPLTRSLADAGKAFIFFHYIHRAGLLAFYKKPEGYHIL
jgi:hypothetical protein